MRRSTPRWNRSQGWLLTSIVLMGMGCDVTDGAAPSEADAHTAADTEAPKAPEETIALLDPYALTPVDADHDPLIQHRPDEVACPPAAWGPEGGGFEVQTGVCDYAAFDQALPMTLEAGDTLSIVIWHDLLDAVEPATAHIAVWIGQDVLWETEVDIPGPSAAFQTEIVLKTTPPPDARLGIHLHNHGFNSWRVLALDVTPHGPLAERIR